MWNPRSRRCRRLTTSAGSVAVCKKMAVWTGWPPVCPMSGKPMSSDARPRGSRCNSPGSRPWPAARWRWPWPARSMRPNPGMWCCWPRPRQALTSTTTLKSAVRISRRGSNPLWHSVVGPQAVAGQRIAAQRVAVDHAKLGRDRHEPQRPRDGQTMIADGAKDRLARPVDMYEHALGQARRAKAVHGLIGKAIVANVCVKRVYTLIPCDDVRLGFATVETTVPRDHAAHLIVDARVRPGCAVAEMVKAGGDLPRLVQRFGLLVPVSADHHAGMSSFEIRRLRGVPRIDPGQAAGVDPDAFLRPRSGVALPPVQQIAKRAAQDDERGLWNGNRCMRHAVENVTVTCQLQVACAWACVMARPAATPELQAHWKL